MAHKLLKPASIIFNLLMLIAFFFIGMHIAGWIGAGKNQGLAGGAIVFGYGILFAGIAFIASFFIARYVVHKLIVRFNWLLIVLIAIAYGITHYRYLERQKEKEKEKTEIEQPKREITKPTPVAEPTAMLSKGFTLKKSESITKFEAAKLSESTMGIGFFKPNYFEYPTLYFYGNVHLEKGLTEHMPMDSIVFANDKYNNPTTTYAPPWLYPEHLKLDYGIINFKALGIGNDFIKVEANSITKQITYLDKYKGTFIPWPVFLLSVSSVEFNENSTKKVHTKPLNFAGEVTVAFHFMQPLLVEKDWMYVKLVDNNHREQGKGWIRWRKDGILLVKYALLS